MHHEIIVNEETHTVQMRPNKSRAMFTIEMDLWGLTISVKDVDGTYDGSLGTTSIDKTSIHIDFV